MTWIVRALLGAQQCAISRLAVEVEIRLSPFSFINWIQTGVAHFFAVDNSKSVVCWSVSSSTLTVSDGPALDRSVERSSLTRSDFR
jgi:hypothetical protein